MGKLSRLRRLGKTELRIVTTARPEQSPKGMDTCAYCGDWLMISDKRGQIEHMLQKHEDEYSAFNRKLMRIALEKLR